MTPHGGVVKGLSEWGPVGGNWPEYYVILRFYSGRITLTKSRYSFIHSTHFFFFLSIYYVSGPDLDVRI